MARGISSLTTEMYLKAISVYEERIKELGDMAKHTSKYHFVSHVAEKTGYKIPTVRKILAMTKKQIDERISKR